MNVDVVIIGAGAAGMMCAIHAGQRGRRVVVLDHAKKLGEKILISGGGRCNFTNRGASPAQYVSQNPHFCKSALSRYTSQDFIQLVTAHGISFHEKKLGQLFCDHSAKDIVRMLEGECKEAKADLKLNTDVKKISQVRGGGQGGFRFKIEVQEKVQEKMQGEPNATQNIFCQSCVIATGGLSLPKTGATGFGYEIAKQFGLKITPLRPALDGFTFHPRDVEVFKDLSGVSVHCQISCQGHSFEENILFTHQGLSGPAALQASLYWDPGVEIEINFLPSVSLFEWLMQKKKEGNRSFVKNLLSELLPARLAESLCRSGVNLFQVALEMPLPQVSEKELKEFCGKIHSWRLTPSGTMGYGRAEVTRGGVDTHELSSKTLESKKVAGLYFIGEVVDVTGMLGGYNFQWAWSSGWAAGQVV